MNIYIMGVIVLFIFFWFSWKYLSQRMTLPCPSWLYWAVELENPFAKHSRSKEIISGLDVKEGMTVLDIGCGPGRLSIPLAKMVGERGRVLSIDIQPEMLSIVQRKAEKEELYNITMVNIPMGAGNLAIYNADRAVMAAVLGEIPNRVTAVKEIYDSLKPGGILAISETIFDPHYQKKQDILNLVKPIGFSQANFIGNKLAYTIYLKKHNV